MFTYFKEPGVRVGRIRFARIPSLRTLSSRFTLRAMPIRALATMIFALALTVAAAVPASAQAEPRIGPLGRQVVLTVRNRNLDGVWIRAERGDYTWRIGYVPGGGDGEFFIPLQMLRSAPEFRLEVAPVGSTLRYTTSVVEIGKSRRMTLRVGRDIGSTRLHVWRPRGGRGG